MGGARLWTELLFGRRLRRVHIFCGAVPAAALAALAAATAAAAALAAATVPTQCSPGPPYALRRSPGPPARVKPHSYSRVAAQCDSECDSTDEACRRECKSKGSGGEKRECRGNCKTARVSLARALASIAARESAALERPCPRD